MRDATEMDVSGPGTEGGDVGIDASGVAPKPEVCDISDIYDGHAKVAPAFCRSN